jgi:alanine or glycine:cation symporter, AGCS family
MSRVGAQWQDAIAGPGVVVPYRWLWVAAVMVGSVATLPTVWSFADVANGLMAVPNLVALIALNGVIVSETQRYLWAGNLDEAAGAVTAFAPHRA